MRPLTATDRAILEFLSAEPSPIGLLLASHPKATVYKRLSALREQTRNLRLGKARSIRSFVMNRRIRIFRA